MSDEYKEAYAVHGARIAEVKAKLRAAFPPGKALDPAKITSTPNDRDEGQKIYNALRGRTWDAIPLEALERNSPSFLTPEGYCYYLPAWLTAGLDFENLDVRDRALAALGPTRTSGSWFVERAGKLSAGQRKAILELVEFIRSVPDYDYSESLPVMQDSSYWSAGAKVGK